MRDNHLNYRVLVRMGLDQHIVSTSSSGKRGMVVKDYALPLVMCVALSPTRSQNTER